MCNHKHGEWIDTYWLCGQCYEKLEERPYKLTWQYGSSSSHDGVGPNMRQVKLSRPTSQEVTGYSLKSFIWSMANHLIAATRGSFTQVDANNYAIEVLKGFDVEFGDSDFDWTFAGAKELIGEDMQYWDYDGPAAN